MQTRKALLVLILFISTTPLAIAQHDAQRDAMRFLADREYDQAAKEIADQPDDPETLYVQAVSLCLRGKAEAALERAKEAVRAGLPLERILADDHYQLKPLRDLKAYREWIAGRISRLIHGPMLGCVTDHSASFWVRTYEAGPVDVVVEPVRDMDGQPVTASAETSDKSEFTTVLNVTGLAPDVEYQYNIIVDGAKALDEPCLFRTFPVEGAPGKFRVVFGGGAGYVPVHEDMWNVVGGREPTALLMLGDNVYIDKPESRMVQRYCYHRRQSRPEWRRLVASTDVASIYDDHDFGTDDCMPGWHVQTPSWKLPVWRMFKMNWVNPAYGDGEKLPGCWYDFRIADVQFIMLDCRYYRDRSIDAPSMLGPGQKKWLFRTLENSDATFKVIASSVPWSPGIKPGSKDPWDGYPEEREEIFSFIEEHKIDGVFLISADRHRSDLRVIERDAGYDLYELESSKLTNHHTHKVVKTPGLIFGYNEKCSFALMDFDTTKDNPAITLRIVNIDDEDIYEMPIYLSQLSFESERNPH